MTTPDWVYNGGGTYQIDGSDEGVEFHSGPVPYDHLPNPGMFYVGAAVLPMDSRWARFGIRGVHQLITDDGRVIAEIKLRRGPLGRVARRWINKHPLQLTVDIYRPEWGEWRTEIGTVRLGR